MTMVIYFDTETTGLHPGSICQISYVMQSANEVRAKNMFFSVGYVEPGAQAVHGFSVFKLKELSNGQTFGDRVEEILSDFSKASLIVSHNISFDLGFLRAELNRLNITLPDYNCFCSMKTALPLCKIMRRSGGYKYPKLGELTAFLGVSEQTIKEKCVEIFGKMATFHDARYDTTALYLAMNYGFTKTEVFDQVKNAVLI